MIFLFVNTILSGLGATLILDLWGLLLKYSFKITLSNFCLVGRWIQYMPEGVLKHSISGVADPCRLFVITILFFPIKSDTDNRLLVDSYEGSA
jgi:hypothetical protein